MGRVRPAIVGIVTRDSAVVGGDRCGSFYKAECERARGKVIFKASDV